MMDYVAYEAPLDSSFQRDRLELVNKGSLGRRRKPTRANLKLLLLSPSLKTPDPDPLSPSSSPANPAKKTVANGDVSWRKTVSQNNQRSPRTEPGLPRTPPEPTAASEAQQFSIQANLKRKNSDLGRSAVLIQTWERRTHSESFSKKRQNPAHRNRFLDKENVTASPPAMPDSYICPRYKGSLQNGDSKSDGELVRSVRGTFHDERPSQQNILKCPRGQRNGASQQEPEWISLSRKLCAKFVEGHIEHHSTNSCEHQELNGVGKGGNDSHVTNGMKRKESSHNREEKKKIAVEAPPGGKTQSKEPPWVPLSRKLCTKFIEEHIEYPATVSDRLEKPADVLEPNGDVRIIEKIGNPKSNKKKARRDSEPEWISLSRKLRAKFIESHIDDPDTIALDNQLNASDPEETSSESLSDSCQEINVQKIAFQSNHRSKSLGTSEEGRHKDFAYMSSTQRPLNQRNESDFVEKECCWEYQEMEFDQESNSGTFQDADFYGEETQNGLNKSEFVEPDDESCSKKGYKSFQVSDDKFQNRISFADIEKSKSLQKIKNQSNDVIFLPRSKEDGPIFNDSQEKKIIIVQFIAHPESIQRGKEDALEKVESPNQTQTPFFNLTTWDEAHYVSDHEQAITNQNSCLDNSFKKDFRSKSLDDLCDSKEETVVMGTSENDAVEKNDSNQFCTSGFKIKLLCKSEELLNKDNRSVPDVKSTNDSEDDFTNNWTTVQEDAPNGEVQNGMKSHSPQLESRIPFDSGVQTALNSKLITEKKHLNVTKSETGRKSHEKCDSKPKCNGVIPNSRNSDSKIENSKLSNGIDLNGSELQRPGMSKWVNFTKAKNASKNEYANIDNPKASKSNGDVRHKVKHKESERDRLSQSYGKVFSKKEYEHQTKSKEDFSSYPIADRTESISNNENETNGNKEHNMNYEQNKDKRKEKSKSLCDLSYTSNALVAKSSDSDNYVDSKRRSVADIPAVVVEDSDSPQVEFQDFAEGCEIPLCAKLVSKQNRGNTSNHKTPSLSSSSVRNESPFSESSHVYEDMFKETTSCPSDSETSSWTVMKKNSYYVNGRSSSMNDLDLSDSCSLSIKCDYASSCSGQSTLQSRHSSCGSSSFYVNLRDYDSHMLEPSLIRRRKERGKMLSNGNAIKITSSSPPTPESLRHLFTSPLSSVHTPTNKSARLLSRVPTDPESHYYSTASATSSAFKHGFDVTPPKPKKTERSSSIKIKDIAHGIILTFRRLQNHSKNSHVSPTHYVDVSHLAEHGSKTNVNSDFEKLKSKKSQKEFLKNQDLERKQWSQTSENDRTDGDNLPDVNKAKARRSSSDSTGMKSKFDILKNDKKKSKNGKLKLRDKGKKSRSKTTEPRTIPTVSRKVQQMADGTLYLVTTVSGDTALPGVYSDSPDTSSELSTHRPVKLAGESNC